MSRKFMQSLEIKILRFFTKKIQNNFSKKNLRKRERFLRWHNPFSTQRTVLYSIQTLPALPFGWYSMAVVRSIIFEEGWVIFQCMHSLIYSLNRLSVKTQIEWFDKFACVWTKKKLWQMQFFIPDSLVLMPYLFQWIFYFEFVILFLLNPMDA